MNIIFAIMFVSALNYLFVMGISDLYYFENKKLSKLFLIPPMGWVLVFIMPVLICRNKV